jgi:hypothetical protein
MDLQNRSASRPAMEPVDILGDQGELPIAALEFGESTMAGVRLGLRDDAATPAVPLPDQIRIASERLRRSEIFRPMLPPQAAGSAKRGDAALGGNPRAGQHRHSVRGLNPRARWFNGHAAFLTLDYTKRNHDYESRGKGRGACSQPI